MSLPQITAARKEARTGPQFAAREERTGPVAAYREELAKRAMWKTKKKGRNDVRKKAS